MIILFFLSSELQHTALTKHCSVLNSHSKSWTELKSFYKKRLHHTHTETSQRSTKPIRSGRWKASAAGLADLFHCKTGWNREQHESGRASALLIWVKLYFAKIMITSVNSIVLVHGIHTVDAPVRIERLPSESFSTGRWTGEQIGSAWWPGSQLESPFANWINWTDADYRAYTWTTHRMTHELECMTHTLWAIRSYSRPFGNPFNAQVSQSPDLTPSYASIAGAASSCWAAHQVNKTSLSHLLLIWILAKAALNSKEQRKIAKNRLPSTVCDAVSDMALHCRVYSVRSPHTIQYQINSSIYSVLPGDQ